MGNTAKQTSNQFGASILVDQRVKETLLQSQKLTDLLRSPSWRLLTSILSPRKFDFAGLIFLNFLVAGIKGIESVYVIALLKQIIDPKNQAVSQIQMGGISVPIPALLGDPIYALCLIVGASVLLGSGLRYLSERLAQRVQKDFLGNLRRRIVDKLLRKSIGFFSEARVAELNTLMNTIVNRFSRLVTSVMQGMTLAMTALITVILMMKLLPSLTLGLIGFFGILFFFQKIARKKAIHLTYDLELAQKTFEQEYMNAIYAIRLIKQSGREEKTLREIGKNIDEKEDAVFRQGIFQAAVKNTNEALFILAIVFFFLVLGKMGTLSLIAPSAVLIPFCYLAYRLVTDAKSLASLQTQLATMYPHLVIVGEFLESPESEALKRDASQKLLSLETFSGGLELRNLSFSYEKNRETLSIQELKFEPHTATALVGMSGSGKSTLMDILALLRNPQKGQYLINGQSASLYERKNFYDRVGYLSQEPIIFNDTLRANLLYCTEHATESEIQEALDEALVSEFLPELDRGLETEIGERGMRVSGGQRQRINLARILIRRPELILLDEATNALDLLTESKIYENILSMKQNKIIIVAAHRLSTVKNFDQIVVFNQGKIVEYGSHEKLMKNKNLYERLYQLQEYQDSL